MCGEYSQRCESRKNVLNSVFKPTCNLIFWLAENIKTLTVYNMNKNIHRCNIIYMTENKEKYGSPFN